MFTTFVNCAPKFSIENEKYFLASSIKGELILVFLLKRHLAITAIGAAVMQLVCMLILAGFLASPTTNSIWDGKVSYVDTLLL